MLSHHNVSQTAKMLRSIPLSPARWFFPVVACILIIPLHGEPNSVEELDTVHANLSQALQYRDQAAKEQAAWTTRRSEIELLIAIAQEETKNLESAVAQARPILDELAARRAGLEAQQAEATVLAAYLAEAAPLLAGKILEKSKAWPEPLLTDAANPLYKLSSILGIEKKTAPARRSNCSSNPPSKHWKKPSSSRMPPKSQPS